MTREGITQLLQRVDRGEADALGQLMPIIYDELRVLAHAQIRRGPDQTMNTTALLHEAYLKLVDQSALSFVNRRHFFTYAATTMRRIVVDNARRRIAEKRGGGAERDDAALELLVEPGNASGLIALDQALSALTRADPRLTEIVEMHVFAGLGFAEIAECCEVAERTIFRGWRKARTVLGGLLTDAIVCES